LEIICGLKKVYTNVTVILLRHGGFEPQIPKLRKQRAQWGFGSRPDIG